MCPPDSGCSAIKDLQNPDNYRITSLVHNPSLSALVDAAYTSGPTDTVHPSPTAIVDDLAATPSADEAALRPLADTAIALVNTAPASDPAIFVNQLDAGNLVAAIGDPISADMALVPFALSIGVGGRRNAGKHRGTAHLAV